MESVDRQTSVLTANAELALIAKGLTHQPPAAEAALWKSAKAQGYPGVAPKA